MNIAIVGHVDHGKSTIVGRLLADTGTLPEGKLEQVRAHCARNAKPFEYAFLVDALKEEQSQGITITPQLHLAAGDPDAENVERIRRLLIERGVLSRP